MRYNISIAVTFALACLSFAFIPTILAAGAPSHRAAKRQQPTLVNLADCAGTEQASAPIEIYREMCKKVWERIDAANGESTWIDVSLASPSRVYAYTAVPVAGAPIDPRGMRILDFDCVGHFQILANAGDFSGEISQWMDAPPRSVAGRIAAMICPSR